MKNSRKKHFDPQGAAPFNLSRAKIELFLDCPCCFLRDRKFGISRPGGPPYTLNNAVDALWKKEFDLYRNRQLPHPILSANGIQAIPFKHPNIGDWRNSRRGLKFLHESTRFLISGAPDEICEQPDGELCIVEVKATSKEAEINLDADWQISYKRQMEIYQWLLRKNGFKVTSRGYFIYCNGQRDENSTGTSLLFEVKVVPYDGDDSWIEPCLHEIHRSLLSIEVPEASPSCKFCQYCSTVQALGCAKPLSEIEVK